MTDYHIGYGTQDMDPELLAEIRREYLTHASIPSVFQVQVPDGPNASSILISIPRSSPEVVFIGVDPIDPNGQSLSLVVSTNEFGQVVDAMRLAVQSLGDEDGADGGR